MVFELKQALAKDQDVPIAYRLSRFLLKQHTATHAGTKKTPAMMMFGRKLPTALTYLKPSDSQLTDEEANDERRIRKNQIVYVKNFAGNPAWMK
ncbi:hypothetical protein MTO96_033849 [Rhipicephalus appendiculatus]